MQVRSNWCSTCISLPFQPDASFLYPLKTSKNLCLHPLKGHTYSKKPEDESYVLLGVFGVPNKETRSQKG